MYESIEEQYALDPVGTVNAVIADSAAAAAAELLVRNEDRREHEYQRVLAGQTESAALAARDALDQKWGKAEVDRLLPRVEQRIAEKPYLIPESVQTSPTALAHALDDVMMLAAKEAREQAAADHWEKVKRSKAVRPASGGRDDDGYRHRHRPGHGGKEERPEWLPQQFLSGEALLQSWREASKKITAQGQQFRPSLVKTRFVCETERLLQARAELAERISVLERAFLSALAGARS